MNSYASEGVMAATPAAGGQAARVLSAASSEAAGLSVLQQRDRMALHNP